MCHPNSASFTEFRWPPRKKRHLFPWIPEASARSSARETHGDDSGGDLRERSSSVLSSSPSEEKISTHPNREKKHIIPLNSSSHHCITWFSAAKRHRPNPGRNHSTHSDNGFLPPTSTPYLGKVDTEIQGDPPTPSPGFQKSLNIKLLLVLVWDPL